MSRRTDILVIVWSVLTAACSSEHAAGLVPAVCSAAFATQLALAAGADTTIDPATDSGCVTFAANLSTTDSSDYVVIAQSAGGPPGATAPFLLRSATLTAAPTPAPLAAAGAPGHAATAAAFDRFLRELAQARPFASPPGAPAPSPQARAAAGVVAAVTPPTVGSLRTFWVCATLTCDKFTKVGARASAVGMHVAIYVDTLAPPNGLDSADIDTLKQVFDTHVYAVDTMAFAGVTDIDANGLAIALMTNVVNSLVTQAQCLSAGYIVGFFFPPDLVPGAYAHDSSNDGEIFYTIVADPAGTLSCGHSATSVKQSIPSTFAHELQHMINFGQHVLVHHSFPEDDWLDEGLSKYAEELAGRSFLPDSTTFRRYATDDVIDQYQYLDSTASQFLLTTTDQDLADVGAGWMYMRYLVDQFGASITTRLVQTPLTGTDNVAAQTGLPFATTATRWALANWVSDLPGFTAPPELRYTSWHFRQTDSTLNARDPFHFPLRFPLVPPVNTPEAVNLRGTLHAGSGAYLRVVQAPGAGAFTLRFSGVSASLPPAIFPRLDVIRLR